MRGEFYKMYHGKWDIATMDLTLEQEAAYLRLCHAMYQNRGPIENRTRALMSYFRCGNVKATALLDALIKAGKIQLTHDGKLTNHHVSEELKERADLSAKRSSAGERGGRARHVADGSLGDARPELADHSVVIPVSLGSHSPVTEVSLSLHSDVTQPDIVSNPLKKKQLPIANASLEKRKEEKRETPKSPEGGEIDRFDEFRAAYPARNTAFPGTAARRRWLEAKRRGASEVEMIAAATAYAAEQAKARKVGTEFVKTADSWLHQERYRDYAPGPTAISTPAPPVSDETWRGRVQLWRDRLDHWPHASPPPNMPGTLVPPTVLAEFGLIEPTVCLPGDLTLERAA